MVKKVLDTFQKPLTEKEAKKYFFKPIKEMDIQERKNYLKNERKYISFFKKIFKRNKKAILKLRNYSNDDINHLLIKEKKIFNKNFKKIYEFDFEKNNMIITSFKDLILFVKLSYRDIYTFQRKYRIYFPKDKIYIYSLSDYYYLIFFSEVKKKKVEKIVREKKLYIR